MPTDFSSVTCRSLPEFEGLTICYTGAPLNEGTQPALFYFCSSAEESLTVDPYNQLVTALAKLPLRIFSITLPCHGPGYDHAKGMHCWAQHLRRGEDLLTPFLERAARLVDTLISEGAIAPQCVAVAGLSRGAFIAWHLAARVPQASAVLGLAPVTDLCYLEAFKDLSENAIVQALALQRQLSPLGLRAHRIYIGNRDVRVGTERCFAFVQQLTETAFKSGIRSPPVEMFIVPSIGAQGHGTSPESFMAGASWLKEILFT